MELSRFIKALQGAKGLTDAEKTEKDEFLDYVDTFCDVAYQTSRLKGADIEIFTNAFFIIWAIMAIKAKRRGIDITRAVEDMKRRGEQLHEADNIPDLPDVDVPKCAGAELPDVQDLPDVEELPDVEDL